jgi:hypothetical protein
MPLTTIPLPYGLRDVKLTPYTDLTRTVLAGSSIDLPNAQTFTFTENEDYEDLRGDDQLQTSHGKGPVVNWDLESGGISFEAYAAIAGGTVGTTGVTPNQIKTFTKPTIGVAAVRPFFKVEGQAFSDSGGDFHGVVWAARATGDIKAEMKDGAFMIPTVSGKGFGSKLLSGPVINSLYDFVQNEAAAGVSIP